MIKNWYTKYRQKLLFKLYKKLKPRMIYGLYHKGTLLELTRISTSSTINASDNLDLANDVFIGHFNFIEASNGISIERGVQITNYISILSHSSHLSIRLLREEYRNPGIPVGYRAGKVHIGEYTFIGPHTTIMPETKIGKGCLIYAYSLVKGNFPDFSIIAGNPAKVIGDVRDIDKPHLENHPDLKRKYEEWAKK
jgi:acetyltransferase-like isoleucine patch superfamily enzyme